MANRTAELADALRSLAETVLDASARAESISLSAQETSVAAREHGWDGVATGYKIAHGQMTEAVRALGTVEDRWTVCIEILGEVVESISFPQVSTRLASVVSELSDAGSRLAGVLASLDSARAQLAATGAEHLAGELNDVIRKLRGAAQTVDSLRTDVDTELLSSEGNSGHEGRTGNDPSASTKAVMARIAELRRQGHAPQRHGVQVTEQQLADRALRGIDPMTGTTTDGETGGPHQCGRNATKFTSDQALVQAEKYLRSTDTFETQKQVNEASGGLLIRVRAPLADVLGADYLRNVRGVRRGGSKSKPTGDPPGSRPPTTIDFTDGTMIAVFVKGEDGGYRLRTMYPNPKD